MDTAAPKPNLNELRQLIEDFDRLHGGKDTPEQLRAIDITPEGMGTSQCSQKIQQHLEALSAPDSRGVRTHLVSLRTQLIHASLIFDTPLDWLFDVIDGYMYCMPAATGRKTGAAIDWQALAAAICVKARFAHPRDDLERHYPREFGVGKAARRLRERGYAIEQHGDRLGVSNADDDRLVARIEELVRALGGLSVARKIFQTVQSTYDAPLARYLITRKIHVGRPMSLDVPWGYLLALAGKHLYEKARSTDPQVAWDELVALATDYAALHDVQDYSPPIFESLTTDELPDSLARRALYDTIYTFPQLRPTDVVRILRPLLYKIPSDRPYGAGWTLSDVYAVIERIYQCIGDRCGPVTLDVGDVSRSVPGVTRAVAKDIILSVLSHPPGGPSRLFSRPTGRTAKQSDGGPDTGNNLYFKPLLPLNGGKFVVLDKSVAGVAFVEAVISALRDIEKGQFQSEIVGRGLENLVRHELAAHGITTYTGQYVTQAGIDGECDQVIDEAGHLVFLESKAKPLTRNANAGSDVDVIVSLAASAIAAQEQAMGHEVQLRRDKKLHLAESNHDLTWQEQDVDRIAVALFDFGVFQDRTALSKLLQQILPARYNAIDSEAQKLHKKTLKDLNYKTLPALIDHLGSWNDLGLEKRNPFFACWFLSAPQLLVLLDGVSEPTEFLSRLSFLRRASYQTYNFYAEVKHGLTLRAQMAQTSH
ncbi:MULTISPECIES: hypothetical protein [Rhodanobacter]|uniref:hypothetical protein n=1 Tax=Rhodanobacter TaxID=75309 RepID=UPI00091C4852|nr:hypothetical protein [Rhodanobacter thiooxydans]UJJ55424.1 hypothetical protein LRK53_03205 [Rhodanobacter thiooxydans]